MPLLPRLTFTSTIFRRNMSSALSPAMLKDLRQTWLAGNPTEPGVKPDDSLMEQWFSVNPEFDRMLREKYEPAVIEASKQSPDELLKLVNGPDDALNLLLLLDQVPRNIYRGKEAKKAYTITDPIAEDLAKRFTSKPLEYQNHGNWPELPLWQLWFVLPLMHSENLKTHEYMHSTFAWGEDKLKHEVNQGQRNYAQSFGEKHTAVIKKFGRYPSRNDALDRKSTPEEIEHLKDGPGW